MKSYLINLSSRPDRLEQATNELKRVGIEAERFEAFTADQAGGNRMLAFNKSQYHCIKKGVEDAMVGGYDSFAVFEDDVVFADQWPLIAEAINELPDTFDMLSLGCNIIGMSTTEWQMPTKYSDRLAVLHNAWQTHAIVWSLDGARQVIELFQYHNDEFAVEGLMIFDEWLRNMVYPLECSFVMNPMVAYQRPDFSDLNQAPSDYTSCFTEGNRYLQSL